MKELSEQIQGLCRKAKEASRLMSELSSKKINQALIAIGEELQTRKTAILAANDRDIEKAKIMGLSEAIIDRLFLGEKRFSALIKSLEDIVLLPCPIGEIIEQWKRPNGMLIKKVRVPIGVIGIIYESRPNVTVDSAALCLKSGNVAILRGGTEAFNTNKELVTAIREGLRKTNIVEEAVILIPTTDRRSIPILCAQRDFIDLLIPRGGKGLIETVMNNAKVPVIKHYQGICHVYVHSEASFKKALDIVLNAKCQRPAVCNAMETLLVDEKIASDFLPLIVRELQNRGVEIRGDEKCLHIMGDRISTAREEDWSTEYLDLILSIKIVSNLDEAINHIHKYGSNHSDAIVTEDPAAAEAFLHKIDSAAVYWNASTRFTDGFEFGFGAEIGISTDKIHARGPMGLKELTSYKYIIYGNGQVRN
ncbi:glutamate-5-semialdehyde dehydrogenase [Methylacidiphilum sp. Yel]|jgi:glutamate-5-semialdehyde dehydrogenase|uniref:glutamate-5-semialdehyde dehydrogenase n=1 Tax=Methylacidiphilum sp. Yel TaxID=1847730 RepID=UPI00106ADB70|nr:glutamate-5-semialdehyde dehydrogenase [Methylacidiphilum sp. Yel]TFE67727.1 glutamate-5-semialdehyde dehydrogenase [Methylacidiphilum sp. Yel]